VKLATQLFSALVLALGVSSAAFAVDATARKAIEAALAKASPGSKVTAMVASPMPNIAEVTLSDQHIVYVSHDGKYLLSGDLFDIANGRNITQSKQSDVRKLAVAKVSNDKRFIYAPKTKPVHKITVFTDIDCGYCRKLHNEMAQYNERGIQIEYLMFPRSGPGTPSFSKAISVWCAKDRNTALTDAKNGKDPVAKTCTNPINEHFDLGRQAGVTGTPSIIMPDGSLMPGYLPADELLNRLNAAARPAQTSAVAQ
jgi:thiol:disulfide interchange protein DsbC